MTTSERPSWQHEPCPPWCAVEHREDDHPDDRFHDSEGTYLPVIIPDPSSPSGTASIEVFLSRFRRVDENEDWIHLEPTEPLPRGMTLSPESARALGRTLITRAALE